MSQDFYTAAAAQRANEIEAERAQSLADLASAKRYQDHAAAAQAVQTLANLNAEQRNLETLHADYVRSITPVPPRQITEEERLNKPLDQMTWEDSIALARQSKYGRDLSIEDPAVQAGIRDVINRRQRGQ